MAEKALASDIDTRDLLALLARRLDLAVGRARLELTFQDGVYVDGFVIERLPPRELECTCRRHAWNPSCPRHGNAPPR